MWGKKEPGFRFTSQIVQVYGTFYANAYIKKHTALTPTPLCTLLTMKLEHIMFFKLTGYDQKCTRKPFFNISKRFPFAPIYPTHICTVCTTGVDVQAGSLYAQYHDTA